MVENSENVSSYGGCHGHHTVILTYWPRFLYRPTTWYFGCYILSECIECMSESICLIHQIENTICFGLADHLQVYIYKITNIPYYFEYKMPSNLRYTQLMNAGLRGNKFKAHSLNLRCISVFQWGKHCKTDVLHYKHMLFAFAEELFPPVNVTSLSRVIFNCIKLLKVCLSQKLCSSNTCIFISTYTYFVFPNHTEIVSHPCMQICVYSTVT
jgi:hypothetical protein